MEEDATLGRIGGFRLIKRLATGGTSDVLLARAEGPHGFERTVVLKRLLSEHQSDPDFARMFAREAAAYARLSHPAIVRLFDFFTSNGQLVMVIEYIDGVSLAKLMTHAAQAGQKLDDRVAFFLAARIFDALSAAHDAHSPDTGDPTPVIHRDVNPSNVLIPWDGHAKLADFGIAKITGGDEAETSQGLIKGTYGYMAPEQVRGERVTIRTDVYAATLVLWELLARRKAFQADKLPEMEILRAMAEPNLPKLDVLRPELPEAIREAVTRGLEPNPAKRAITAEEVMGILRVHFDAEDARGRLERVLAPLAEAAGAKPARRSFADTISEDMRETAQGAALPSYAETAAQGSPAMTLPLPTEPRPAVPPRPPPLRKAAPQAAAAQVLAPVTEPLRRQTPSGFRAVPQSPIGQTHVMPPAAPGPMRAPSLSKPTLAGGFSPMVDVPIYVPTPLGSEPATLQTKAIDGAALITPLPPQPFFAPPPPVHAPTFPPILPPPAVNRQHVTGRSLALTVVLATLAGIVVLALAAAAILFFRMRETRTASAPPAVVTSAPLHVSTPPPVLAVTSAVTATPTPTPTSSATAQQTAVAKPASSSVPDGTPTPGPDEGVLILPASAHGHRVFIDGHVQGDGSSPIVVPCGQHSVQIGSAGKSRDINVPCGALARIE